MCTRKPPLLDSFKVPVPPFAKAQIAEEFHGLLLLNLFQVTGELVKTPGLKSENAPWLCLWMFPNEILIKWKRKGIFISEENDIKLHMRAPARFPRQSWCHHQHKWARSKGNIFELQLGALWTKGWSLFHSFLSVIEQCWLGGSFLAPGSVEMGSVLLVIKFTFFYTYLSKVLTLHGQTVSVSEWRKLRHSRRWVESREWPSGPTQCCQALSSQEQNNMSSPTSKTNRCVAAHHPSESLPSVSCHCLRTICSWLWPLISVSSCPWSEVGSCQHHLHWSAFGLYILFSISCLTGLLGSVIPFFGLH